MAKNKSEAQIKFAADTKEFKEGLTDVNRNLKLLTGELKLNGTQLKGNAGDIDLLSTRQDLLQSELEESGNKIALLEKSLEKAGELLGENSTEYNKLANDVLRAKNAEAAIKNELEDVTQKLSEQEKANEEAAEAANRQKTATETLTEKIEKQQDELNTLKAAYTDSILQYGEGAEETKELGRQIADLSDELKKNQSELEKAEDAADKLDKSFDDAGEAAEESTDGFTIMKGALADLVSNGIQWAIGKLSEFGSYLTGLPEETRELRQDMATLTTSFDNAGMSADTAKGTWKELYAVFGEDDRAVETANHISRMASNQKDLNDWVTITTGVWGTYQDSLPVEGLAEAASETSKTGQVTGVLADALNWSSEAAQMFAGYMSKDVTTAEDAFNVALSKCTTEQERQTLITETLKNLYGDAAETYRDTAGAQMEAKEATADNILAEADLADTIEPLTTKMEEFKTELVSGAVPAIEGMIEKGQEAKEWCEEHETAVALLTVGVGTLAVAIGAYTAAEGLKALAVKTGAAAEGEATIAMGLHAVATGVSTAATTAFGAAVAFVTSPITLTVAAIGGLIAVGVLLYKNWDTVSAKATELKNKVVGGLGGMCEKGIEKFTSLKDGAVEIVDGMKEKVSDGVEKIKGFFSFKFKWPDIPLPHFSVSPSGWKVGDLLKGSIPKLGIKWYADGAIFTKPTVINTAGGLKGFGEAGYEAALPLVKLREYMGDVMDEWSARHLVNSDLDYDRLGDSVAKAISKTDQSIKINKREFGRIVREVT